MRQAPTFTKFVPDGRLGSEQVRGLSLTPYGRPRP